MTIFFALNGVGVVFLLYVLANFWKEGHRRKNNATMYTAKFGQRDSAGVIVVTRPISQAAQGGIYLIPFQSHRQEPRDQSSLEAISRGTAEWPVKRASRR
jgi:hypothetical protein